MSTRLQISRLIKLALIVPCATFTLLTVGSTLSAGVADLTIDTGCSELPSYTGVKSFQEGTQDVYVRMAKRGQSAKVTAYVQKYGQFDGCHEVGSTSASGDKWTKLGSFRVDEESEQVIQLSSAALDELPSANRPSVMVLPAQNPPCVPNKECDVNVDGEKGYVRPTGTLLNQDSLQVLKVVDPKKDQIRLVKYYVDDRLVYETKRLEPFNYRYVSYADQPLKRVIEYTSGQQVVIDSKASSTYTDNFFNFVFRLTQRYPLLSAFAGLSVVIGIITLILLIPINRVRSRYNERVRRGFIKKRSIGTTRRLMYQLAEETPVKFMKWTARISALIFIMMIFTVIIHRYVAQITSIQGESMQKSYFTGDQVFVNKAPVTLAAINNREYVPKRGEVVIVRAVFGNTSVPSDEVTDMQLIKRVIGLPGERIVIKDGRITVFNADNPAGFEPDKGSAWESSYTSNPKSENIDIKLTNSELFVIGDNRPASADSRLSGPIATKEVIGSGSWRVWPLLR